MKLRYLLVAVTTMVFCCRESSVSQTYSGDIQGKVLDGETKTPLVGANILLLNTKIGSTVNSGGEFVLKDVPVGSYTLEFRLVGYDPLWKTDVIVKSDRTLFIEAELVMAPIEAEGVEISGGYFSRSEDQPTSITNFSYEEIRRAPGSAGDVSRIIMGLPSIAKVNDQSNSLIVRGGSPIENAFFVDNIEIPNINHFPAQGSSGGPIGLLNVSFVQDVNFFTGGFSSAYGDKLSSVMEVSFREGNREKISGQSELSFAGVSAAAEGPLFSKKGSWMVSARRSYVDLLLAAVHAEGAAVHYGDYQGKFVYDLDEKNTMSLLFLAGYDHSDTDSRQGEIMYGSNNVWESTIGLNWRSLWSGKGYSQNSISLTSTQFHDDFYETGTGMYFVKNRSIEQTISVRNVNYYRLRDNERLEFGFEAKLPNNTYDNYFAGTTDQVGNALPAASIKKSISAHRLSAFVNYIWNPLPALTTSTGIRLDYYSYNSTSLVSPRISASYALNEKTSLTGATGIFYQSLPFNILTQDDKNSHLKEPTAYHYVLGVNHLLTENMKLTVEVYDKEYTDFPLDPSSPSLFILDELAYRNGFFSYHDQLVNDGRAYSRGVELTVQKKLAEEVYGLLSGSYSTARYRGLDGAWRDRVFDNRFMMSAEGGYKPNDEWEFSLRWIYAGGPPYTPFDETASRAADAGVFDPTRINAERQLAYHSLNVRFDKRFHFTHSNFIFYFSIWNLYDRKNVASYYWNKDKNEQNTIYQWGLLPVIGMEYDF